MAQQNYFMSNYFWHNITNFNWLQHFYSPEPPLATRNTGFLSKNLSGNFTTYSISATKNKQLQTFQQQNRFELES